MPFFKDYNKEVKDLFTKNTAEGKAPVMGPAGADGKAQPKKGQFNAVMWKVESKLKPTKDTPLVINPVGDAKGVTSNVEFLITQVPGLKGKMAVKPDICAKPTITYECCGKKLEVTTDSFKGPAGYEVTFEDKQKAYAMNATLNASKFAAEASVPVAAGVETGVAVSYGLSDKKLAWSAGARYQCCKNTVFNFTTAQGAKFVLGAAVPFKCPLTGNSMQGAVQADFNRANNAFDFTAGVTGPVVGCPLGSSFKLKVNKNLAMSISNFFDLAGWKIASTFDVKEKKLGCVLTRE